MSCSRTRDLVNTSGASGIAMSGFDPVAFFTDMNGSKPVHGSPSIKSGYKGATYFFLSEEHKRMFDSDPEQYAPQFGGFCAFGVSMNALYPVDVTTAQVYKNKLYINLNQDAVDAFENDKDESIKKATKNWPDLVKKNLRYSCSPPIPSPDFRPHEYVEC